MLHCRWLRSLCTVSSIFIYLLQLTTRATDITDIDPPEGVDVERDIVIDPPPVDASQYRRSPCCCLLLQYLIQSCARGERRHCPNKNRKFCGTISSIVGREEGKRDKQACDGVHPQVNTRRLYKRARSPRCCLTLHSWRLGSLGAVPVQLLFHEGQARADVLLDCFELCAGKRASNMAKVCVIISATAPRGQLAGDALVEHLSDGFICKGTRLEEDGRAHVLQDGTDCPLISLVALPAHFSLAPVQLKQSCQEDGIHRRERVVWRVRRGRDGA